MKIKSYFSRWFSSNFGLQLFAVILAIGAWFVVNSGRVVEENDSIKIEYVQLPKGLAFQRTPLKEFKISLKGSAYRIRSLKPEDLVYMVDLSSAHPGANRVDVDLQSLRLPLDIEANYSSIRTFYVHLEEVYMKEVPVRPVFLGNLPEGYVVSRFKTTPEILPVVGPRSIVSKIEYINLEVPLMGRESSFSTEVKPRLNYPDTSTSDSVLVEVEIGALTSTREFTKVPVVVQDGGGEVRITPSVATVNVEGIPKIVGSLEGRLKVAVSVDGLKKGRYRIRGRVDLPPEVRILSLEPTYFLVEVVK